LDEDAFDPKKLFNEEEYSTLIIDRGGFSKKENTSADLLENLLDPKITRQESEEIFSKLKENNTQKLMVDGIKVAERVKEKTVLTAACWESGLDFSADLLFFVELACHPDFQLAMEALTVVESMEPEPAYSHELLTTALNVITSAKSANTALVNDLVENIKSRIS
jgi:homoserine dehydrogenase